MKISTLAVLIIFLILNREVKAQKTFIVDSSNPKAYTIIAGSEYDRSGVHQALWGRDYRREWTTPVTFPVLNLDSAYGGLTPVREGGGRQTKTLRLIDAQGRNWVLRSVNKTYLGALPEIVQGTFVEGLANDQIATNHPYAALAVPTLAEAARVFHTNPRYFVVPYHPRLGEFNAVFANTLCLLEERPDGTQTKQQSFGNPDDIVSSEDMMAKLLEENDHLIDQESYVRARLFDMFLGDWGRHKDNWRWSKFDSGTFKVYRPVAKDRDQTWAKFEGTLLRLIARLGKFKELQSFDESIDDLRWYNYPAYPIDKRFTNQVLEQSWTRIARSLQATLTDKVIESAVRQMPQEIFAISGEETIRFLKARRGKLEDYAREYYRFLAQDVEIPGTAEREYFEIKRVSDKETSVKIFRLNKKEVKDELVYSRNFLHDETREIRLHGIGGKDKFVVEGQVQEGIKIHITGGTEQDTIIDRSTVNGWTRLTKVYDNLEGNSITKSSETDPDLSDVPKFNKYDYEVFRYDSRGIRPIFYYNSLYRFYVGIGYNMARDRYRDGRVRLRHSIGVNYSLIENSIHPYYNATFGGLINNRWDLNFAAGFDGVRRYNYFGRGNKSTVNTEDISYYWAKLKTFYTSIGIQRLYRERHLVRFDILYNGIKVVDLEDRYVSKKQGSVDASSFNWKHFAGPELSYTYFRSDDPVVPTKGFLIRIGSNYMKNLSETSKYFVRTSASANFYIPVSGAFSIAIKTGASTVTGKPEFHQLNSLGGFYTLRGYWRYRFWGKDLVYNQNEIRWLPTVRGKWFSGRIGLLAFYDHGRVWDPGEESDNWHSSYGPGVMLVPFNRVALTVTYGFGEETSRMNIRLGKFF